MTRIQKLRLSLFWTQGALAAFLGVDQSAVSRIEAGGPETGPVSRMLDHLQRGVDAGLVAGGVTPEEAMKSLLDAIGAPAAKPAEAAE